ncbi:MAG TPA: aryl-sulfate sulfotransferase [Bryobacteraceae bacterium]|nr:aryl-sulfate sulfotransferase [Bryobacteraceae bacterium]
MNSRFKIAGTVLALLLPGGCGHVRALKSRAHRLDEGLVEATDNPQVAVYSITPRSPSEVTIDFGLDERYGLRTWSRHADGNAPVRIFVAGMLADATYHMRARIHFADGTIVQDTDHVFHTAPLPLRMRDWRIQSSPRGRAGREAGLELLNSSTGVKSQIAIVDLKGRILWSYEVPERQAMREIVSLRRRERALSRIAGWFGWKLRSGPLRDALAKTAQREAGTVQMSRIASASDVGFINPVKLLPNGDLLLLYGLSSQSLLSGPSPEGTFSFVREINLAGETVRQITAEQLNEKLHASGHRELQLQNFHHDVEVLPNGHWIVIANQFRPGSDPDQGQTDIFGDVLIDLDNNLNPVWTWSTFDHLDINRRPMWSPDWTHSNAVIYTPDDGNLLLSMRHQSWIIKIDYRNGSGTGKVLWRLGAGGDFRLLNGRDPEDWQYAQHLPSILGARSAGVFYLTMVDNGDNRPTARGGRCVDPGSGTAGGVPCYTTIPVFEVDERAMTTKIVARKVLPPDEYSNWGGGTDVWPDGSIEATLSSEGNHGKPGMDSTVMELTPGPAPQEIWEMETIGTPIYRAERIGSPYPGVQW